jgi:predicted AlkP superfamily phosphohydrolase/phosphomutase
VVSDHGFQGASRSFDINEYLYSRELLKLNTSLQQSRERARRISNLKHTLGKLGLHSLTQKGKKALNSAGIVKEDAPDMYQPLAGIDWERTLACVATRSGFAAGYSDIILKANLDAERLTDLYEGLKSQVDSKTGKSLVDALYTNEVYGTGPYALSEPHLLLIPEDGITFRLKFGNERFWEDVGMTNDLSKRCGIHQKNGVLLAYGGAMKNGFKAPNAEIYDIVPTVLRSMGLPLPYTFDGRVLDELFVERKQAEQTSSAAGENVQDGLARRKLKKLLEI